MIWYYYVGIGIAVVVILAVVIRIFSRKKQSSVSNNYNGGVSDLVGKGFVSKCCSKIKGMFKI